MLSVFSSGMAVHLCLKKKRSHHVGDVENWDFSRAERRPECFDLFFTCFLKEGWPGLSSLLTTRGRTLHVFSISFQSICWRSCFVLIKKGEIWTQTHRENTMWRWGRDASISRLDRHQGCQGRGRSWASLTASEGTSPAHTWSWPPAPELWDDAPLSFEPTSVIFGMAALGKL